MPIDALPKDLQAHPTADGDGTDHDNAAQRHWSRGWTAFGPRVEKQRWTWARVGVPFTSFSVPVFPVLAKWRMFPALLLGYNVARWMGVEDTSIIFVGRFVNRWLWLRSDFYQVPSIEMQLGHPKYGDSMTSMIRGRWWNADEEKFLETYVYGPSPIQNFAFGWSFQITWPLNLAISFRRKREAAPDLVLFFRFGARWDSLDSYFVFPSVFIGGTWN